VLRETVTSKGGTTAAALSVMAERDLPAVIAMVSRNASCGSRNSMPAQTDPADTITTDHPP
jgi:pyrroline-5-carboxylate reductase